VYFYDDTYIIKVLLDASKFGKKFWVFEPTTLILHLKVLVHV
jgi:hypothetical protein